jgi:hypothetical protein
VTGFATNVVVCCDGMLGMLGRQHLLTSALMVLAIVVSAPLGPALGEPVTGEARQIIEDKLLHADLMSNARRALEFCREAEQTAAGFDRDAYYDGAIAKCLGYAEMHLQNVPAACIAFARALAGLKAVGPDHHRYIQVRKWLDWIRSDRSKFGC